MDISSMDMGLKQMWTHLRQRHDHGRDSRRRNRREVTMADTTFDLGATKTTGRTTSHGDTKAMEGATKAGTPQYRTKAAPRFGSKL